MKFKIGTFNLYNLVLPDHIFYEDKKYSKSEYEQKINWVAGQLVNINADIVAFQEVFHQKALDEAIEKSGIFNNKSIVCNETGNLPRVGIVSNFPVLKMDFITDFPKESILNIEDRTIIQFQRPVLKAVIEISNKKTIVVFVVHLKSRRPIIEDNNKKNNQKALALGKAKASIIRIAEATALRFILINEMKNKSIPIIVMGDFNDSTYSTTNEIITGNFPRKKASPENKKEIWDNLLYNSAELLSKKSMVNTSYTHISEGRYELVDHILLSEELVLSNPNNVGYIEHIRIYNDHLIDGNITDETVPVWQSDHGQITATIRMSNQV